MISFVLWYLAIGLVVLLLSGSIIITMLMLKYDGDTVDEAVNNDLGFIRSDFGIDLVIDLIVGMIIWPIRIANAPNMYKELDEECIRVRITKRS